MELKSTSAEYSVKFFRSLIDPNLTRVRWYRNGEWFMSSSFDPKKGQDLNELIKDIGFYTSDLEPLD